MHRSLQIDPKHQGGPGDAHNDDIQPRQHANPEMHLEQRASQEHGSWPVEKGHGRYTPAATDPLDATQ